MANKHVCLGTFICTGLLAILINGPASAANSQLEAQSKAGPRQDLKALNPQPEVPSKPGTSRPKQLNPQPEVPSKPINVVNPKELNPQPEVPSKPKKKPVKKKPIPPRPER